MIYKWKFLGRLYAHSFKNQNIFWHMPFTVLGCTETSSKDPAHSFINEQPDAYLCLQEVPSQSQAYLFITLFNLVSSFEKGPVMWISPSTTYYFQVVKKP